MSIGAGPPARSPQLSPDGKWVWDGKQWLPVSAASPPPRPPQISPDGKWVWNGKQWLPVAHRDAVFPAFAAVEIAEEAEPEPVAPVRESIPVIGEEPEPDPYAYNYAQPVSSKPAWERAQTGLNKYLYIAAGVVVLVIAAIWVNSLGSIALPWDSTTVVAPKASPTPPITARTDAAAADRYLTGFLDPTLTNLAQTETVLNEICNGTMTFSCRDDMSTTQNQVKKVLPAINLQIYPQCIAPQVAKMKVDLNGEDSGLALALQGYQDNRASELAAGLARFRAAAIALAVDRTATDVAEKAYCSNQQTGP